MKEECAGEGIGRREVWEMEEKGRATRIGWKKRRRSGRERRNRGMEMEEEEAKGNENRMEENKRMSGMEKIRRRAGILRKRRERKSKRMEGIWRRRAKESKRRRGGKWRR